MNANLFIHCNHGAGQSVDIFHRTPHWMGFERSTEDGLKIGTVDCLKLVLISVAATKR